MGTYRYARQLLNKNGPLQSLPTKLLTTPTRYKCGRTYRRAGNAKLGQNLLKKLLFCKYLEKLPRCPAPPLFATKKAANAGSGSENGAPSDLAGEIGE